MEVDAVGSGRQGQAGTIGRIRPVLELEPSAVEVIGIESDLALEHGHAVFEDKGERLGELDHLAMGMKVCPD
jgi:hypothetical protein